MRKDTIRAAVLGIALAVTPLLGCDTSPPKTETAAERYDREIAEIAARQQAATPIATTTDTAPAVQETDTDTAGQSELYYVQQINAHTLLWITLAAQGKIPESDAEIPKIQANAEALMEHHDYTEQQATDIVLQAMAMQSKTLPEYQQQVFWSTVYKHMR